MARGARGPVINLNVDPDVEAATNPEESGGEGVASLFDFQGDARVRVLHRNEKTQRYEPHGYFPADSTEESILNEFGGGRYRVQLLVRDAAGREIIKTQRDIDLPGSYRTPAGDLPGIGARSVGAVPAATNGATPAAAVATLPAGDDLMSILKAGIIDSLLGVMKASKQPAPTMDPAMVEILKAQATSQQQMMALMVTIITPLLARDGDSSKATLLTELAQMKELVAPPVGSPSTNPMDMFNTMLETFTRMREVADDISPQKSGSGDPLMDSIPQLVGVIAEQHQLQKERAALGPVQRVRSVPGPAGGTAEMPVVGTIQPEPLALWQQVLRTHAGRLVAAAVAKHDPDPLIGTAIMFAPPPLTEALKIFFHRKPEEVAADVLVEIPQLHEHMEWVMEFVGCAQERLFPDEFSDDEVDEEPEKK
jgi:hypothetical protein